MCAVADKCKESTVFTTFIECKRKGQRIGQEDIALTERIIQPF